MKEPKILLEHILECIQHIESFMNGLSEDDFLSLVEKQDAVERRLIIIGEAVKNLPEDLTKHYHQIAWRNIASMKNLLVHEYFEVSLKQVWIAVTRDIPLLKIAVLKMLEEISGK